MGRMAIDPMIEPRCIVDTHVHLWSSGVAEAPWLRAKGCEALRRGYCAIDFCTASRAILLGAAVAVIAAETRQEALWLLQEAGRSRSFRGVVGWIDPDREPGHQLDELSGAAENCPLVGIRHSASNDSGVLRTDPMLRMLTELGRRELTFDLLVGPRGLPDAIACVRAHPETVFVLDHLGNPPVDRESLRAWADSIAELSKSGNVVAKISGLAVRRRSAAPICDVVDAALEAFGPARLMLGSDWPISTLATGYAETLDLYLQAIADLSPAEIADIRSRTAMRTYKGLLEHAT